MLLRSLVCLLALQAPLAASDSAAETLLIRNVRLLESSGEGEPASVSILIRNKKLDVVTPDEISPDKAQRVIDAEGGFVIGKLQVGELASFLILAEDPRENVEILLDTKTYARFAIHEGEILKNAFVDRDAAEVEPEPDAKKRGWLAYAPPPMALPYSYLDDTKWNKWETRWVSGIFLAALVMDRQYWIHQDDESSQQVGDLDEFDRGEIRGFRFGAVGTLNFKRPVVYTFFAATTAFDKGFDVDEDDDDLAVFDYRLDFPLPRKLTLSVGKQKEPISMERLTSMVYLPMQERSAVADAVLTARNVGAVLSGTALKQRLTWAGGLFNDAIDHGQSLDESASQLVGRATWLPYLSQDESHLVHLGLGVRRSNTREGVHIRTTPEFNSAPLFVDSGFFAADNATSYNAELSWRKGPYWVAAETIVSEVDAPVVGDPVFRGHHVTGSWSISGEVREYNKRSAVFHSLPVARSVREGGWGAWELGLRWSAFDASDGLIDGGELDILSLGLNWWLTPTFSASVNYRHVTLDRFGVEGVSDGFTFRIYLALE
jgi:phosphate-selective porin OprO/OprP